LFIVTIKHGNTLDILYVIRCMYIILKQKWSIKSIKHRKRKRKNSKFKNRFFYIWHDSWVVFEIGTKKKLLKF